jgi:hypothetical protein
VVIGGHGFDGDPPPESRDDGLGTPLLGSRVSRAWTSKRYHIKKTLSSAGLAQGKGLVSMAGGCFNLPYYDEGFAPV